MYVVYVVCIMNGFLKALCMSGDPSERREFAYCCVARF